MKIIYEDNHIIVVEKPVNIPSQGDKTGDKDMLSLVKEYLKEKYIPCRCCYSTNNSIFQKY